MAEVHDLFAVDASNIARFPEGMAPSTVNNGARATEGIIARWFFDMNGSVVATLSTSAIQMTANRTSITLTGTTSNYVADLMMAFTMGSAANLSGATININGIGAIALRDNNGGSLSASVIPSGAKCLIVKDGTNNYFRLLRGALSPSSDTFTPAVTFGGAAVGVTYAANGQVGRYTQSGRTITFQLYILLTSKGSSTGQALVTGLPKASTATTNAYCTFSVNGGALTGITGHLQGYLGPSGTSIVLAYLGTGSATSLDNGNFAATSEIMISGSYEAA